ncbi:phage tail tape measure protein [Acidovorax sp. Leaf160]|uniref:phage tail tape measure protein n=1 Tax=Acidovorax sp. Leaf160 TaxID=1736280 RepID=UPI000701A90C|nr:phage tail tape measure protein [Acidovorax sp. Leaf160]KQR50142.1 hypothetical protein ASF94_06560 [Acidovorax sp. Leaf160]
MADKLRLEVLLAAVDKVTAPLKRMGSGARALAGDLSQAEAALKKLESQQRAVAAFKRTAEQLRTTRAQLQAARQGHAELAAQTHQGAEAQKAHAVQLRAAAAVVRRLTASFEQQASAARRARAVMESRGISNPAAAEAQLSAQIDKTTQALQRKHAAYQRMAALEKAHGRVAMHGAMVAAGGAGAIAAGRRTVATGLAPVGTFIQHEDAMLGIARQVAGARDNAGNLTQVYRDVEKQVRELSTRLPQTTVQIAAMTTAAARMEVPTEELGAFVELSSEMATAFDAVPDQLAESMGKVAKNFKIPVTQIRGLADSINYLDDNAISKGADIIDVLNRTSGVASTVGISAANSAALGSTLLTLGERAETAGTAINAIFTKFAAATKGTKKFKAAVAEIGMTTEQIQKGMAKDAAGTLLKVAEAIRSLPEDNRIGVMAEMVGLEHSDTLAKLVDKPEELTRQMELANGSAGEGSMTREAQARNATLSAQLQMQKNRGFNAMAVAGETLKAPLLEVFRIINPLLEGFTAWMQANPALVGGILKAVVVLGLASAAMGAVLLPLGLLMVKGMLLRLMFARLMLAFTGWGGTVARVAPALTTAAQALFAWGQVRVLTPAIGMLARAWAWAGGAVARLGPWLLRGAQWLSAWGSALAAYLPAALRWGAVLLRIAGGPVSLLALAANMLYSRWADVVGGFWLLKDDIGAAVMAAANYVRGLGTQFFDAGVAIVQGMANGITSRIAAVRDAISMVAGDSIDWFKEKLGIRSPSRVFMQLGGYVGEGAALGIERSSAGVRVAALGMAAAAAVPLAMPDLAMAAGGMPAMAPMAAVSQPFAAPGPAASGSSYQITINAAAGMDAQAIARAVAAELDRRERERDSRRFSRLSDID